MLTWQVKSKQSRKPHSSSHPNQHITADWTSPGTAYFCQTLNVCYALESQHKGGKINSLFGLELPTRRKTAVQLFGILKDHVKSRFDIQSVRRSIYTPSVVYCKQASADIAGTVKNSHVANSLQEEEVLHSFSRAIYDDIVKFSYIVVIVTVMMRVFPFKGKLGCLLWYVQHGTHVCLWENTHGRHTQTHTHMGAMPIAITQRESFQQWFLKANWNVSLLVSFFLSFSHASTHTLSLLGIR